MPSFERASATAVAKSQRRENLFMCAKQEPEA